MEGKKKQPQKQPKRDYVDVMFEGYPPEDRPDAEGAGVISEWPADYPMGDEPNADYPEPLFPENPDDKGASQSESDRQS